MTVGTGSFYMSFNVGDQHDIITLFQECSVDHLIKNDRTQVLIDCSFHN